MRFTFKMGNLRQGLIGGMSVGHSLGIIFDQIVHILRVHRQSRLTPGGLIHAGQRLADVLEPW